MSINGVIEKDIYIGIYIIVLFVTLSISTRALGFVKVWSMTLKTLSFIWKKLYLLYIGVLIN